MSNMAKDTPNGSESSFKVNNNNVVVTQAATNMDSGITEGEMPQHNLRFWMCFVALMTSTFLMALDLTGVSTALPIIIQELGGSQFEWVGSAYALSATAFQPLSGGMAQVFGRRFVMLQNLFFFAAGSAICGAAPNLNALIAGRTIQGVGAGGISALSQIILSDLVPLQQRGNYNGIIALAQGLAISIAPVVGGALAQRGQWRWFFYLNLPICAISAAIVVAFLNLKTPRGTWREKIAKLDWTGNAIVVASTTACVIALTWGGVVFPWSSARVLVPLVLGLVGLVALMIFEAIVPRNPLIPFSVVSTMTGISGYIQTYLTSFYLVAIIYYLPVYYQACKGNSPIASGVNAFGISFTVVPFGIASGLSITKSGHYRPQLWLAWISLMVAAGLFSTLHADSSRAASIGYQIIVGLGLGILMTSTFFPVLAPLHVSLNANALAFFMFVRFFSQIWGVTIGGTVLQNELNKRLPAEFLSHFPEGTSVAYSIVPVIGTLPEPLQTNVRVAFAESLRVLWQVLIGIGAMGFVSSLFMRALPLHTKMDERWGISNAVNGNSAHARKEEAVEMGLSGHANN